MRLRAGTSTALLLALLLLTACTSIRPVSKVGLLAPFEGLYREDGYAALHGLRTALDACAPGLDIVPLALDDAADPAQALRSAQKMRLDPALALVLGPFGPAEVSAVQEVMTDIAWQSPLHLQPPGGFAPALSPAWATVLVETIRATVPVTGVTVIGLPARLTPEELSHDPDVRLVHETADAPPRISDGAVLWLGDPAQGAAWLASGALAPDASFFLGTAYGADVFAAHAPREPMAYWMIWRDVEYNRWSETFAPTQSPAQTYPAYLTYRATCPVLQAHAGIPVTEPPRGGVDLIPLHAGLAAADAPESPSTE